jgi:hypothetical protein
MIVVSPVPTQLVHQAWPKVEKFFAKVAVRSTESYSLEQMRTEIFMNRWALLIAEQDSQVIGAMGMQYQNRMNERVAFIFTTGGKGIARPETWAQVASIFKANGATAVEGGMRPSAYRLWRRLGFIAKYQVAGMKL